MSRHSKNASTRQFFTSGEREKEKGVWGTKRMKLAEDAQRKFGQCEICLAEVREPVASPYGFLYCKECILGNLLVQQSLMEVKMKEWEEKRARAQAGEDAAALAKEAARASSFAAVETGVSASTVSVHKSETQQEKFAAGKRERMDQRSQHEKVAEAAATAFWVPHAETNAGEGIGPPPEAVTKCPGSGKQLKAKQLIEVKLSRRGEGQSAGAGADAGAGSGGGIGAPTAGSLAPFECPACNKAIVYQPTILLAACGHVLCDKCTAQFVVPSKTCYVCSTPVTGRSGVVPLVQGGSGYVAHKGTQAEATKYTPSLVA